MKIENKKIRTLLFILLYPLNFFAAILLGGFSIIISILLSPIFIIWKISIYYKNHKLKKLLRKHDRLIPWETIEQKLVDGNGTFIVEEGMNLGTYFWWTEDDVKQLCPCDYPTDEDIDCTMISCKSSHPYFDWCRENYLNPESGRAFRTSTKIFDDHIFPIQDEAILDLFPDAKVVRTFKKI